MGSILSAGNSVVSIMMRLCLLALVVFSALTDTSEGSTIRVERDACDDLIEAFQVCTTKAYTDYTEAIAAGDDGRPDWFARKSCNYVTAAVEDCGNTLIGDCMTEEEVNTEKDRQIKDVLQQLSEKIDEWDSEKCPAVKEHLARTNPVENGEGGDSEESVTEESNTEGSNTEESNTEESSAGESNTEESNTEESNTKESNSGETIAEEPISGESNTEESNSGESNTENTDPESGSAIATASLSLVLVLYLVCCA